MRTISSYLHQLHLLCVNFFRSAILTRHAECDINFHPNKSKFLIIPASKRLHLYNAKCKCSFFVGKKMIDIVDRFSHLGHIITLSLLDGDDIIQRHNTFVGQTNNVFCLFNKLS